MVIFYKELTVHIQIRVHKHYVDVLLEAFGRRGQFILFD